MKPKQELSETLTNVSIPSEGLRLPLTKAFSEIGLVTVHSRWFFALSIKRFDSDPKGPFLQAFSCKTGQPVECVARKIVVEGVA
jgi:hypothetical protein